MATLTPKQRALLMVEGGLSEGMIAGILGVDLADVERLMLEADPEVDLPGAGDPDPWVTLSYGANWRRTSDSAAFEAQASKTKEGLVLLRGRCERITSVYTLPTTIATLPVDFRPPKGLAFAVIRNMGAGGANVVMLLINTDGTLVVNSETETGTETEGVSDSIFLDNITYNTLP